MLLLLVMVLLLLMPRGLQLHRYIACHVVVLFQRQQNENILLKLFAGNVRTRGAEVAIALTLLSQPPSRHFRCVAI